MGNDMDWLTSIDEPLAQVTDGTSTYYHADGLGSIVALTDAAKNVVQRYSYDSFGMVTAQNPEFANAYTFTGREWDRELGLYYYRARYYDPMEGRFISRDPIGIGGNFYNNIGNVTLSQYVESASMPYLYVGNNPINFIDPEGLMAKRPEDKAEQIKKWKDNFDKYKGLYDACKGDMNDPNNCEQCCKQISQSFPHTSVDPSGWWIMYNQCKAAMCLECIE